MFGTKKKKTEYNKEPKRTVKYRRTITSDDVIKATEILNDYKRCKMNLERRIVENEQWWKMQHWDLIRTQNTSDPEPASAWLFNAIANKHADAMDNYPEPAVLPRERSDERQAQALSQILPVVLERNDFEKTYSDVWWYKLKTGTGCYGVFWNNGADGGRGDIDIRQIDILNIFWEGGVKDIQKSRNLFTVELVDNDILKDMYPQLGDGIGSNAVDVERYLYDDAVDTSRKSAVIDWYYKVRVGTREVVHYCKYVGNIVLYASENDPYYAERGYYDHGLYPFVFDTLFVEEGTPCGFGYIDIMKDVQLYIDKLNQIIIKNAMQAGRRRFFISDNTGINEEEFADWSREFVHVAGNIDERNLREITVSQLDSAVITLLNQKIGELKEVGGNRDVLSGGTYNGVTAASAIAALQEAGNKLSRDMIKGSYRAFRAVNYMMIELIRQFYDGERCFRITAPNGETDYVEYVNDGASDVLSGRRPIFDVSVTSQKASPFSKTAQNELAKELFAAGIFNPANARQALICLDMMDFDGKNEVMEKISASLAEENRIGQMNEQMQKMAEIIEYAYGSGALRGAQAGRQGGGGASSGDVLKKAAQSEMLGRDRLAAARGAF